jgi:hypothetical protein
MDIKDILTVIIGGLIVYILFFSVKFRTKYGQWRYPILLLAIMAYIALGAWLGFLPKVIKEIIFLF